MGADLTQALGVTVALALVTTLCLLVIAPPLAWWIARSQKPWRSLVEALIALPLVLPPTVLGFYFLLMMTPNAPIGSFWQWLTGDSLAFTFAALVIGSIVYSLPFVCQPLTASFRNSRQELLETATLLGFGPVRRFIKLVLPMNRSALIAAAVLGFAHTLGEFGIVLMIGGNIPGETRVLSILLFDQVESLDYAAAHVTAGLLVVFALLTLTLTYRTLGRR